MFANGISATFRNGILIEIKQKDEIIPLDNGPLPVGMKANFKEGYEYMQVMTPVTLPNMKEE